VNIYETSTMYRCKLLIIIFCHSSLAILQFPYPQQTFALPKHPSNLVCTVHITVATFKNYTTSDITERFLASNRDKIIPTLSTMLNRSISIVPVISFFEPCTISILIDATIDGSSYIFSEVGVIRYIDANAYVYRGWRQSAIIFIYLSCASTYYFKSLYLPHRLFYHTPDCGPQNMFPNQAFIPDPLQRLWNINDQTHSIHDRQFPLAMRRSISIPKYGWDRDDLDINPDHCLASRWRELSEMFPCTVDVMAVQHYQHYLNFSAVANAPDEIIDYGELVTHYNLFVVTNSTLFHAIDSRNDRVIYCDRNSDSPTLRLINLSSPFSFQTWVTLVFLLILCAIACSFTVFDMRSVSKNWTIIIFSRTFFNSLVELIVGLLEKDVGKNNCTKALIGLIGICVGNTYKNYLTIELVYPRAGDAIQNFTALLDLNFKVLQSVDVMDIWKDQSTWLKDLNYHLEIDETKREKYVREAKMWLQLVSDSDEETINELASARSKNAWILSMPYYTLVEYANLIAETNYPLSCHLVKRPFAHKFVNLYFLNPKAEEFKWLTARFLDHGLFEFWKHLYGHMLTLDQRNVSLQIRSKKSKTTSTEALDISNFIGQVHLIVFYIVISVLTAICVGIFLLECVMQKVLEVSLLVQTKFTHFGFQLLRPIVRSLFLMSKLIGRLCQNHKPF
jgi:hypothetical protein